MLLELLQGDGSDPSTPISADFKAVSQPQRSSVSSRISVELETQTAAKPVGRQCPEGHVLLRKQGTGRLPQVRAVALAVCEQYQNLHLSFGVCPCILVPTGTLLGHLHRHFCEVEVKKVHICLQTYTGLVKTMISLSSEMVNML